MPIFSVIMVSKMYFGNIQILIKNKIYFELKACFNKKIYIYIYIHNNLIYKGGRLIDRPEFKSQPITFLGKIKCLMRSMADKNLDQLSL